MQSCLKAVLAAASLVLAVPLAQAADFTAGPLKIESPWIRATPKGASVAGGYLTIVNTGKDADRLIGGTVAFAGRFELHQMKMEKGVMQMRPVPSGVEIKPGETVALTPGGYHVMFMDIKQAPKAGESVKGTLVFEKAGSVEIEYSVSPIGAPNPMPHGH
jgi:copper(I)-binding protein